MDIFGYLAQRRLQYEIDRNRRETWHTDQAVVELEARLRVQEKSTAALWALIKLKTGWTDEEVIEQAKALEVANPGQCPSCGRRLLVQHSATCSWCGQLLGDKPLSIGSDINS